ncbi:MAG: OmpA family protein, partial [Bacteroidetes bacterium]|nr:OmpA family protein [Bacteroidota bacterium]
MEKLIFILSLVILPFIVRSQSDERSKSKFVDAEYDFLFEDYQRAAAGYEYVYHRDSTNSNVCYRLGMCYLFLFDKEKAIPFLEMATRNTTQNYREGSYRERYAPIEALLYLGHVYRCNYELKNAKTAFTLYRNEVGVEDFYAIDQADFEIGKCKNAEQMLKKPLVTEIRNMGKLFNDVETNYHIVVSADEKSLAYATKKTKEQIFFSQMTEEGEWSNPKNISRILGSAGFYVPVWLSHDGKTMLLYSGDTESGDLFIAGKKGNKWTDKTSFSKTINSKYRETSGCLSADGNILIFSSDKPGGYGRLDLYCSFRNKHTGEWTESINLGPTINTPYDEAYPYLMADGYSLYFCSEGHFNIGGFDIFLTKRQSNGWTVPMNIGFPVNTTDDDMYFTPLQNGEVMYVCRHDSASLGKLDIYRMTVTPRQEEPVAATDSLLVIKQDTLLPLDSITCKDSVLALDTKYLTTSGNITENDTIGNLVVVTETHTDSIDTVLAEVRTDTTALKSNIQSVHAGNEEFSIVRNILFDFSSTQLNRDAKIELEKVAVLMKENKDLAIEVIGYTDSKGDPGFNRRLSESRAEATVNYLTGKGISRSRFTTKGMGENSFLAVNMNPDGTDNPEGRMYNRRVELKLQNPDKRIRMESLNVPEHLRYTKATNACMVLVMQSATELPSTYFDKYYYNPLKKIQAQKIKNGYAYTLGAYDDRAEALKVL